MPHQLAATGQEALYHISSSLEFKLLRMSALVCGVTAFLTLFYDYFITGNRAALGIEAVALVAFAVIYRFSGDERATDALKYVFLGLVWLVADIAFLFTGGLGDSFVTLVVLACVITTILMPRRYWTATVVFMLVQLAVMMALEYRYPGLRKILGPDYRFRVILTSHIFLMISFGIGVLVVGYMKLRYDELRRLTIEQNNLLASINTELAYRNTELARSNESIRELNAGLEEKVAARTAEIRSYQARLLEAAFFNSHRMRGPLANILGLLHAMEPGRDGEEADLWHRLMQSEAEKLDQHIQEVQLLLKTHPEPPAPAAFPDRSQTS